MTAPGGPRAGGWGVPEPRSRPGEPEDLLVDLDAEQREAVLAPRGPVVVIAGPGTGKTRTATHRIAYGVRSGATPERAVLAVTFTRRAAGEMRQRLADLGVGGVATRTFHSAAMRQLRHFWPRLVGGPMPTVLSHRREALAAALAEQGLDPASGERDVTSALLAEIEWAKAVMVTPQDYPARARELRRRVPRGKYDAVADAYEAYEGFKVRHGRIDLADVVLILAAGLEDDRAVAAQVHETYRHLVVDEYQDVSPAQDRLLRAWLGDRDDLFVVGDPRQTIYTFAGASADPMLEMPRRMPGAAVVTLARCYRCAPEILRLADAVVSGAGGLWALTSANDKGGAGAAAVEVAAHDDAGAESRWLVDRVGALCEQGSPGQTAVLVRTRDLMDAVAVSLERAGVPVLARDDRGFFSRPEVREAVSLLRVAARFTAPRDDEVPALRDQVVDVLSGVGWAPEPPRSGSRRSRESWHLLEALVLLADSVRPGSEGSASAGSGSKTPGAGGMADLVARLDAMAADDVEPEVRAVTVTTMHAAKGREWDVVVMPGLVDGILPAAANAKGHLREEEQRLLYVALTRARNHLVLSWHRKDRGRRREPTPLLPESLIARAEPRERAAVSGPEGGQRGAR